MKQTSSIKIKIPPPIVTLVFAFLMFLIAYSVKLNVPIFGKAILLSFGGLVSALLLLPALIQFYRSKTTVNPLKPETAKFLVVSGVYKYSRNPMYLGMATLLLTWGLYLGNPLNLILFFAYILYMNRFQIMYEEVALQKIFGEDFSNYKNKVRRWI